VFIISTSANIEMALDMFYMIVPIMDITPKSTILFVQVETGNDGNKSASS